MKKQTLDHSSQATNQGSLRITRAEYVRYHARTAPGRWFLYANSFLPVSFRYRRFFGGYRWSHFAEKFRYGDTNPAVVLDPQAGLVAAFTDLDSQLQKRFPVVKIFVEKLRLLPAPAKAGDTFAAISVYSRGPRSAETGRWSDFHPVVVDCVKRDPTQCEFTKALIADWEWKALQIGLAQIPDQTRPGLYDIALPEGLPFSP